MISPIKRLATHVLGLLGITLALTLKANFALADLSIHITRGNDQAFPVASVPFLWEGQGRLNEDIAQIIGDNLNRTGLFKSLAKESFVSLPSKEEEVVFRDWQNLSAKYLIIGQVLPAATAGQLNIHYQLFDVASQKSLLKGTQLANQNDLRTPTHLISDKIYLRLTGQKGIFSTRLAYITAIPTKGVEATYRIFIADADGKRSKEILKSSQPLLSPDWSPDGKKLVYVSFETGRGAIFVQELATGKRYQLTNFKGINGAPVWSPNGQQLALTLSKDGNPEIYIYNFNSKRLTRVTNHYAIDTEPAWSPDGKSLVFTSSRSGGPQIYKVDLATGKQERVTFEGSYNARARYSPTGRHLYIVTRAANAKSFGLAALDLTTGRQRTLTTSEINESPGVAPNGSLIIYAFMRNNQGLLGVVSNDGRIQYELPAEKGYVREPAWSPYLD